VKRRPAALSIVGNGGAPDPAAVEVLTREQVAAWLQVRPRQVERLGVPCIALGRKTVRYLKADVLAWLELQRRPAPKAS
jgi:hypothetical protein